MTIAVFAPKISMGQVILLDPPDNTDEVVSPPLVWSSAASNFEPDRPGHFQIQISLTSDFSSIVADRISFQNQTGFQYESAPGVWTAFPANGLAVADFGKRVRFITSVISQVNYYWRVRPLQQV